jgi:UDP-3-O-[3-hydroxymyristoyl] glucosamine N-acyltransferase
MRSHFRLSELIHYLKKEKFLIQFPKDYEDFTIEGFSTITDTKSGTLTWSKKSITDWESIKAAVVICPLDSQPPKKLKCFFIRAENPRLVFTKVLNQFHFDRFQPKIDETAIISETCELGENILIGPYVVIDENVKIGDGTTIHSHVKLYANTTINENCTIHSGTVIGGDGFGYERDTNHTPLKIKHIGGVTLANNVEIGSHSCIDRGTLTDTVIGENTKISNSCNISHNVIIGRNTMIGANASVNGSTTIGDNVWISPGAVLNNGLVIGEDSIVGLGAVVMKDVKHSDIVAGVPARSLKKNN